MRTRIQVAAATSAVVMAASMVVGAPSAGAAERSAACAAIDGLYIANSRTAIALNTGAEEGLLAAGETVSVVTERVSGPGTDAQLFLQDTGYVTGPIGSTLTLTALQPASRVTGLSVEPSSNPSDAVFLNWWFACSPVSPGTPTPSVPAWVQAYGRASADAACEAGWDASWQAWAEPVTGGWVCTRSVPSLG